MLASHLLSLTYPGLDDCVQIGCLADLGLLTTSGLHGLTLWGAATTVGKAIGLYTFRNAIWGAFARAVSPPANNAGPQAHPIIVGIWDLLDPSFRVLTQIGFYSATTIGLIWAFRGNSFSKKVADVTIAPPVLQAGPTAAEEMALRLGERLATFDYLVMLAIKVSVPVLTILLVVQLFKVYNGLQNERSEKLRENKELISKLKELTESQGKVKEEINEILPIVKEQQVNPIVERLEKDVDSVDKVVKKVVRSVVEPIVSRFDQVEQNLKKVVKTTNILKDQISEVKKDSPLNSSPKDLNS